MTNLAMPKIDRKLIARKAEVVSDLKKIMVEKNFREGANNHTGEFVLEKAFVD